MNRPSLALAIALNHASREDDEWFDEPDELDRVENALHAIDNLEEPVEAAAVLAYRVARAQGFGEANKRTALLLARWLLDGNGIDGAAVLPPDDRVVAVFSSGPRPDATSRTRSFHSSSRAGRDGPDHVSCLKARLANPFANPLPDIGAYQTARDHHRKDL